MEIDMAVFGKTGSKKGKTTGEIYTEMHLNGKVFYPNLLNVKVPSMQRGKATQTKEGGVSLPKVKSKVY
jgi:hypothetical protein